MAKQSAARTEAKFMKGQVGVDGQSNDEPLDLEAAEQAKAKEALYRGRTWLGREALTWWLFKSESTEPLCKLEGAPISLVFVGRLTLKAASGDVTEAAVKGVTAPYAGLVKQALRQGLLVHGARVKLSWGEQTYEFSLDAEHFDVKAAKLPEVLEESDDTLAERLELVARLCRAIDAVMQAFAEVRTSKKWKDEVAAMQKWLA